MRSGYVKSSFLNIAASDKNSQLKLIDLGSNSLCRIFYIQYLPAKVYVGTANGTNCYANLELTSGTSDVIWEHRFCSNGYNSTGSNHIQRVRSPRIPEDGILATDDVYVKSSSDGLTSPTSTTVGINFVSVIYQVGIQGS